MIPPRLTMRALAGDTALVAFRLGPAAIRVLYLDDVGVWGTAYPSLKRVAIHRTLETFRVTREDAAVMLHDATERGDADPNGTDHTPVERRAARRAAATITAALLASLPKDTRTLD